jgi:hypothetical protein
MIALIDDHRGEHGVEPICAVLPIAPSTYHSHAARRADPSLLPRRVTRDAGLIPPVARVFEENFEVYGARKVWRQLQREGQEVARCTIEPASPPRSATSSMPAANGCSASRSHRSPSGCSWPRHWTLSGTATS